MIPFTCTVNGQKIVINLAYVAHIEEVPQGLLIWSVRGVERDSSWLVKDQGEIKRLNDILEWRSSR